MAKPTTVAEYIADEDNKVVRAKLKQMRAAIRAAVPKAKESIKWNMPAYTQVKNLIFFAVFKNHVSLFRIEIIVRHQICPHSSNADDWVRQHSQK